jgi:hypothetical protein
VSDLPRILHTPVRPLRPGGVVFKAVDGDDDAGFPRVSPEAVLTYPQRDLQGDYVEPDGGVWDEFHRLGRVVNFDHGPAVGTGVVSMKSLDVNGRRCDVPVGVTTFFQSAADLRGLRPVRRDARGSVVGVWDADTCLEYAAQVAPLVADGTLDGVSLEFRPAGPEGLAFKAIGPSPMLARPAYHIWAWEGVSWAAACHVPVNPDAGYARKAFPYDDTPLAPRIERAYKLVHERPNTLDLIRKSLTPLARLARTPGRTTAAVRRPHPMATATHPKLLKKAEDYLPPPDDAMATPDAPPDPPTAEAAPASDMKPTPAALFQLAQTVLDAADMGEQMAAAGEHTGGLKLLARHCEAARTLAAKIKADAEKIAADVGGDAPAADEADADAEPEPVELDEETGVLKSLAFDGRTWRPRRWTAADLGPPLRKAKPAAPPGGIDPADLEIILADYKRLKAKEAARGL